MSPPPRGTPRSSKSVNREARRVNREWAFSGETEKSGGGVPPRTHRANHNDSPRPEGENRIVRKLWQWDIWRPVAARTWCPPGSGGGNNLAPQVGFEPTTLRLTAEIHPFTSVCPVLLTFADLSLTSFLPKPCELRGVALDCLEMPAVGAQNRQEIGKAFQPSGRPNKMFLPCFRSAIRLPPAPNLDGHTRYDLRGCDDRNR